MHPPVTFAPARVAWGRTDRLRGLVSFQSEGRPIRLAAFLSRRFKLGASSFAPRTQYIHVHVHVHVHVAQLEVLAALAVYMSLPSWLAGRRVLHFIDNQGALSNLISCSSKDLDCAWMVHDFAIRAARLSCGVWFDYVRSKANLASRAGSTCFWAWAAWRCSRQCLSAAAGLRCGTSAIGSAVHVDRLRWRASRCLPYYHRTLARH